MIFLTLISGFGAIRTISAETFATRWVDNIWPATGRSADTRVETKNGEEQIQMKPPASFSDVIKKKIGYHEAVFLSLTSKYANINVQTGQTVVPRRVQAANNARTSDVGFQAHARGGPAVAGCMGSVQQRGPGAFALTCLPLHSPFKFAIAEYQLCCSCGPLDGAVPPGQADQALARSAWVVGAGRAAITAETRRCFLSLSSELTEFNLRLLQPQS